ncbi:alpha-E domain-containing protein [Phnomibacter sp. MR]|uniref:alpha-E domain-containing protein n=1 Tax=Phnomibacter sp. MR TaxID=3042318 RepID=UPI003A7FEE16
MMLSRIADNMFWLNRYMERADGLARATRYFYILGFDSWEGDTLGYGPLLQSFTSLSAEERVTMQADSQHLLRFVIQDAANINSLKVLLSKARENARGSQDRVTKELWEQVNAMYHFITNEGLVSKLKGEETLKVLDQLEKHCLLYNGIVDSTMPRGLGWEFMNLGKFIERSLQTVDLVDAYLSPMQYDLELNDNLLYWRRLLYALSGYELYLKNNRGTHHSRQVISQVIFNADFPRSVIYSLKRIEKYLQSLLEENPHPDAAVIIRRFGRLKSMVEFTDTVNMNGQELKELVKQIRHQLWDFSAEFSRLFFSYT